MCELIKEGELWIRPMNLGLFFWLSCSFHLIEHMTHQLFSISCSELYKFHSILRNSRNIWEMSWIFSQISDSSAKDFTLWKRITQKRKRKKKVKQALPILFCWKMKKEKTFTRAGLRWKILWGNWDSRDREQIGCHLLNGTSLQSQGIFLENQRSVSWADTLEKAEWQERGVINPPCGHIWETYE